MKRAQAAFARRLRGTVALDKGLLEQIAADPGITMGEILACGDVSWGTLHREILKLEDARLIERRENGREIRLFLTKTGSEPRPEPAVGPTAQRILRYLKDHPGSSTLVISSKTGASPRVAAGHLRRLRLDGWVTARGASWRLAGACASDALAAPASLPFLLPFPQLQGYAPLGLARGAPARGPENLRLAFRVAFEESPRAAEISLKVEEALLRPRTAGVTPLRVALCRAFASLDILPVERESLVAFIDDVLPPQGDGWRRSIATAASPTMYRISGGADSRTPGELFQWCRIQVKQSAMAGASSGWSLARERAASLLGEADWRAPDAPPLRDVLLHEWEKHTQEDGLGRMALLTELMLAVHVWGAERELPVERLEPHRRDVFAVWKLLLLSTALVAAGRPAHDVLACLLRVSAKEQVYPPADAVEELVRRWPRQWVPYLAAHLLEYVALDDAGESTLLLEAARVHAEERDYPAARYWLRWMPRTVTQHRRELWKERKIMMESLAQIELGEAVPRWGPSAAPVGLPEEP